MDEEIGAIKIYIKGEAPRVFILGKDGVSGILLLGSGNVKIFMENRANIIFYGFSFEAKTKYALRTPETDSR